MYHLILLFAAAALLCEGRSANVKRHMEILSEMDNHLEPNVPTRVSLQKNLPSLMQQSPGISTLNAGSTIEVTCEAVAAPAPSIHWFKNDEPVYQHDLESNEIVDANPTSLARITSTLLVPRTAPTSKYTCLVVAGSKTSRASSVIVNTDLTERSKLVPLAPRIVVSYKVFVDSIGTSVVLPCHMRGHPRPQAVWFNKYNLRIHNDPRMKVLKSGELVISPLLWDDMGEYTCHATNIFGTATIKTFVYPAQPSNTEG